jgi:signal transduction histidine kinase
MFHYERAHRIKACAVAIIAISLLILDLPTQAAILWSQTETTLVHDNGAGKDILHGAIKPQDNSSSSTLYFKFRVDPISDAVSKSDSFYLAGLTLFEGGSEHLAVGSGRISWGYSAFNAAGKGPENTVDGEFALNSATPEAGRIFQYVRRGIRTIIVFKVQYVPGQNAHVTVWLNPDLSLGATENNQPTNITTRFEANATFNEIHLVHQGGGGGWNFSDLAIATSFEDFLTPKFWQRWWFRAGAACGLLISVAFTVWLLERRRSQKKIQLLEREWAVATERERIAKDIHDELGAEFAQIGLLADVGSGGQATQTVADQNFLRIAQRARSVVAALDEIVWAVDPRNDNLTRLADYLCQMADECFDGSPIRCQKEVPTQLPPFQIRAEVRHDLTLAVKEAFTNLLKHAKASEARLCLTWNEPELIICVEDNGGGFEVTGSELGNGLGNQRKRLERIGGTVELNSAPGKGTRITFQIRLETGG